MATGVCPPDRGTHRGERPRGRPAGTGFGFHPDLTGAENLRITAALLGITRREVNQRYDEILAFADIGEFINEPLRIYSSGMMMRLAFSVAVHVDPEVLIVDEVLGVGDLAFAQKCTRKILDFRESGKSLLCVSHSMEAIRNFCSRAIWLDHGSLVEDGPIGVVTEAYQAAQAVRRQQAVSF